MSGKAFFTNFDLEIRNHGNSLYKTCEIRLMILPDTVKTHEEFPFPNVNDLPSDMRNTLLEWLQGASL